MNGSTMEFVMKGGLELGKAAVVNERRAPRFISGESRGLILNAQKSCGWSFIANLFGVYFLSLVS